MKVSVSVTATVATMNTPAERYSSANYRTSELTSSIGATTVVFPLSESVQHLLGVHTHDISTLQPQSLSTNLRDIIESGQVIWQSKACCGHAVIKCTTSIVVKIVPNLDDYTEYTSMQYLAQHAPEIPAPKPLGSVISNGTSYIFMSFVPGVTVDKIWSKLSEEQKASIRDQLSNILLKLRQLKVPRGVFLGGVSGEGCKDTRRHTRICQAPISTCAEFEDFKFSNPHFGSSEYIALLRGLSTSHAAIVCFSHGDLRAENVVVQPDQHGSYFVTGVLDWEKSGFYPDYFECTKATSNMSSSEVDDWYLYLPPYASPKTYPLQWLVDRIWDIHVA